MRYALISDIHGNLEALNAVLDSIKKNSVDEILCLGDIVGYGPNPNECVEKIINIHIDSVMGNHDFAMLDESQARNFNPYAEKASVWTRKILTPANLRYLSCLSFMRQLPDVLLVHASPSFPGNWDYILDIFRALEEFDGFQEKICFIGHSHIPAIFNSDGDELAGDALVNDIALLENQRYIINVGSVGQPRDHDSRACYGILDTESSAFSLVRVEYDVASVVKKIQEAGLPEFLWKRLPMGI